MSISSNYEDGDLPVSIKNLSMKKMEKKEEKILNLMH